MNNPTPLRFGDFVNNEQGTSNNERKANAPGSQLTACNYL